MAPARARSREFRDHPIAVGDQDCLSAGREPDVLAQLVLQQFEPDDAPLQKVASRGYFASVMTAGPMV